MIKIYRLTILITVLINQGVIAQYSPTGKWIGEIVKENKKWSTELNISGEGAVLKGYFNVPDYGLYHLVFDTISLSGNSIHLHYKDRNTTVNFTGTIESQTIRGDWDGLDKKASFSVHKISKIPVDFGIEEVSFNNGDAKLSGTLILPKGKGPFPAVVQVHGSGNQTRSEDFYRSRAFLFASHGIAALIYDRRGKGRSSGIDVSMNLLADDAIAGINFLRSHQKIERNKIGIMGFSQGGYIGPLAASRSKAIAFVIAGAAPGVTPDKQNDFDVENELRNRGRTEDTINYVLKFRKDLRAYQYTGAGDKNELEARLELLRKKWWFKNTLLADSIEPVSTGVKDFLTYDPLPSWSKIKVPVLLTWGQLDDVVPVERSKTYIENTLIKNGNRKYTLKIFPNAGHGIGFVNNSKEWDWPRLADGYHQLLIDWTKRVVKSK